METAICRYNPTITTQLQPDADNAFAVTKKWTDTPAMLVELGFVTNKADADCLLSEEWNTSVASAIDKAISDYFA